jgi:metal-dependent amidase/aminoacylase/carboxypeptidase family protein
MAVFQPGEETAGVQAMIDDGLFNRFSNPDVILGQHVVPSPAGLIADRTGTIMAAADSLQIRLFGRRGARLATSSRRRSGCYDCRHRHAPPDAGQNLRNSRSNSPRSTSWW